MCCVSVTEVITTSPPITSYLSPLLIMIMYLPTADGVSGPTAASSIGGVVAGVVIVLLILVVVIVVGIIVGVYFWR